MGKLTFHLCKCVATYPASSELRQATGFSASSLLVRGLSLDYSPQHSAYAGLMLVVEFSRYLAATYALLTWSMREHLARALKQSPANQHHAASLPDLTGSGGEMNAGMERPSFALAAATAPVPHVRLGPLAKHGRYHSILPLRPDLRIGTDVVT